MAVASSRSRSSGVVQRYASPATIAIKIIVVMSSLRSRDVPEVSDFVAGFCAPRCRGFQDWAEDDEFVSSGLLGAGCWVLGAGCWVLGAGCWVVGARCWVLGAGCWCWVLVLGAGARCWC